MLSSLLSAQKIKIIAIIGDKITRVENSYIELESCSHDNLGVMTAEIISEEMKEIVAAKPEEQLFYYLINRSKTEAIAMFKQKEQICRTNSWHDGEIFPIIYFRN